MGPVGASSKPEVAKKLTCCPIKLDRQRFFGPSSVIMTLSLS